MLAFVPRWGIAPRHHQQSVAEHSYYVTLYASEICNMLGIKGACRGEVLDAALRHDATDAWESDVPGPAKRSLFDPVKRRHYAEQFAAGMNNLYRRSQTTLATGTALGNGLKPYSVKDIVKVADLIDEAFFLAIELALGNKLVSGLYQRELSRLDQAAIALAGDAFAEELITMIGVEVTRINEEGAVIPTNNDDLNDTKEALETYPVVDNDEPFPDV